MEPWLIRWRTVVSYMESRGRLGGEPWLAWWRSLPQENCGLEGARVGSACTWCGRLAFVSDLAREVRPPSVLSLGASLAWEVGFDSLPSSEVGCPSGRPWRRSARSWAPCAVVSGYLDWSGLPGSAHLALGFLTFVGLGLWSFHGIMLSVKIIYCIIWVKLINLIFSMYKFQE